MLLQISPRNSTLPINRCLAGMVCALLVTSCGDPEREAKLQWREEEVNAKEQSFLKREQQIASERKAIEAIRSEVAQREKQIDELKVQLASEIEKTRKTRHILEIRQLRGPVPDVKAERCIVIDPNSGEVLWEKNADKRGPIASTQKLLTAILIIEGGNLDQLLTVEKSDAQCAPVRFGLKEGEQYSRRQLLTALMVKSPNDIAQALARDNAGSVAAFVDKMNAKAAALGLENSFFVNPHGLPDAKEQYCTARDLSRIAAEADKLPDLRAMIRLKSFKFTKTNKQVVVLENTNRVLRGYAYCDGMKTGFTQEAGYCLVSSGEKNGQRRIVVVLNDTDSSVWRDSQALLEWSLKG